MMFNERLLGKLIDTHFSIFFQKCVFCVNCQQCTSMTTRRRRRHSRPVRYFDTTISPFQQTNERKVLCFRTRNQNKSYGKSFHCKNIEPSGPWCRYVHSLVRSRVIRWSLKGVFRLSWRSFSLEALVMFQNGLIYFPDQKWSRPVSVYRNLPTFVYDTVRHIQSRPPYS